MKLLQALFTVTMMLLSLFFVGLFMFAHIPFFLIRGMK